EPAAPGVEVDRGVGDQQVAPDLRAVAPPLQEPGAEQELDALALALDGPGALERAPVEVLRALAAVDLAGPGVPGAQVVAPRRRAPLVRGEALAAVVRRGA